MSRAFVTEDVPGDDLPDRPVSRHPNYVTKRGLALIEAALDASRREYAQAQALGDRRLLSKAGRELRYWSARRASAQLVSVRADVDTANLAALSRSREKTVASKHFESLARTRPNPPAARSHTSLRWPGR